MAPGHPAPHPVLEVTCSLNGIDRREGGGLKKYSIHQLGAQKGGGGLELSKAKFNLLKY